MSENEGDGAADLGRIGKTIERIDTYRRAGRGCSAILWGILFLWTGCESPTVRGTETLHQTVRAHEGLTHGQEPRLRVYLWDTKALTITSSAAMGLWNVGENRQTVRITADQFCVVSLTDNRWRVIAPEGENLLGGIEELFGVIEFRPEGDQAATVFRDQAVSYPGSMRLIPNGSQAGYFSVVNVVGVENYLAGVVGSEMYPRWQPEALRAQSIASRTYALYQASRREGNPRGWDIGSDQMSQMYTGLSRRHSTVAQAVRDTRGIVLAYGEVNQEKIFPAYYSAICGGHTEDAVSVFGEAPGPLKGQACPYCEATADPKLYRWAEVSLAKNTVSRELTTTYPTLKPLGRIVDIQVAETGDYGRLRRIELTGDTGRKATIRAEEFRLAISSKQKPVRSSWCQLTDEGESWRFTEGRGWGHGVGLCQFGAQQMARLGKDCIEILAFYYPQAVLLRAY
jgi:stage II sporulation protein D